MTIKTRTVIMRYDSDDLKAVLVDAHEHNAFDSLAVGILNSLVYGYQRRDGRPGSREWGSGRPACPRSGRMGPPAGERYAMPTGDRDWEDRSRFTLTIVVTHDGKDEARSRQFTLRDLEALAKFAPCTPAGGEFWDLVQEMSSLGSRA